METEAETAKRVLGRLNNAPYTKTSPREFDAPNKPTWYVTCLDGYYYGRTAHADTAWGDARGRMWLDSTHLENSTNWVEWAYGEKGAIKAMDIDYRNLTVAEAQAKLRPFTKVYNFIETCKRILAEVSEETGVKLEMMLYGQDGIAWFFFRAQIDQNDQSLDRRLQKTNRALKRAYDMFVQEEIRRLRET